MGVFFGEVTLETVKGRASYHDISDEIRENIKKSELKNGCVVISSAHTTCSLYFDECMHDTNYWGDEYLQADINDVMEMLNTDAHLKSSIFGSPSLTFIVKDGEIQLGALGKVYFVDWDQLRERTRKVQIMVMGE